MGLMSRLRAIVDPWGARAAWLNKNIPGMEFDRARAKQIVEASRSWSDRSGAGARDRWGRPVGMLNRGPRNRLTADAPILRREGELLARNSSHARHAVRQIVNSVLSNGANIKPSTSLKSKRAQLLLTTTFSRSFEETTELDSRRRMNFHGLSRLWLKTKLQSGGVILRIRPRKMRDRLAVPIAIETLTYSYLYDGPKPLNLKDGETFADGIVFNALGEDIRYYFWRQHPDDTPAGRSLSNVVEVHKYDADGIQQIIHWFEPGDNDDHIGTPRGAITYPALTKKMDYDLAIIDRKRVESKRVGIWEADHGADPDDHPGRNTNVEWVDGDGVAHAGPRPGTGPREAPLSWAEMQAWVNEMGGSAVDNGETMTAPPGYKFKPYEISNFQDHPAFSEGLLREVAVGFFAPEWLVTGDLRKLSFAGGELGLLYWKEDCKAEFDDFVVTVFNPIWKAWVHYGERANMWAAKDVSVTVRQNRMPSRDLLKDLKYVVGAMNVGLISREDGILELGKDTIEEVNEKILREAAWARENNVPLMPGLYSVSASGSAGVQAIADEIADAVKEASQQTDPEGS